ncbi:hypothetical protein VPNG_02898 [Cytospora leucostoma]|uniref:Thioesterase domain-containing protein n=1 Tax=Cytospora leucostoma TaxID=1230097 RepID=A0A423XJ01_9PEZI|nr:hypothetical protein VPNG_02898 [Cytospora leucostoma]
MSSTSTQRRLLARLAQRGQWRIASTHVSPSLAPRHHYQQNNILRQRPGRISPTPSLRGFSTSPRLLQEQHQQQQTPPPTSAHVASSSSPSPTPGSPPTRSSASSSSSTPSSPQPADKRPCRRPRLVSTLLLLLLGLTAGTATRAVLAPPPPLIPGSDADTSLAADVRAAAQHLPLVRQLQTDPDWCLRHHDAYEGVPAAQRAGRITTGALGGSRGVGAYQHVWHNARTGEALAVIYFGTGTIGWPGVVHGGVIATILDEHSARAALGDPSALVGGAKGLLTAKLDITYKRPTLSSDFYVVRASAVPEGELAEEERGKRARKVWVDARIETVEGQTCVASRALFVTPKGVDLRAIPENF